MDLRLQSVAPVRRRTIVVLGLGALVLAVAVAWLVAVPAGRLVLRPIQPATVLAQAPADTTVPVPRFRHVYTIVLENRSAANILKTDDAPYLHELAARFGVADAYQAVAHPSQPNYLALFSGSTQGVTDDDPHDLSAPTIADQLDAAGSSWRVYAENVPTACYRGASAKDGPDGPGTYVRKHEPAISFTAIGSTPSRCANIRPLADFDPAAATYSFIAPNMCHDAHDCPIATADAWLRTFVPRIIDSPAWSDGGVLFITFDEADSADQAANRVLTLVIAPNVAAGTRSSIPHTHYSLLRTIQAGLGVDCLAASCTANTLGEFFR